MSTQNVDALKRKIEEQKRDELKKTNELHKIQSEITRSKLDLERKQTETNRAKDMLDKLETEAVVIHTEISKLMMDRQHNENEFRLDAHKIV